MKKYACQHNRRPTSLTHCGSETLYGDIDLSQHWPGKGFLAGGSKPLVIRQVQWRSYEDNFTKDTSANNH